MPPPSPSTAHLERDAARVGRAAREVELELPPHVHREDVAPAARVRQLDAHDAVEAPRPHERRVEDLVPARNDDDDDDQRKEKKESRRHDTKNEGGPGARGRECVDARRREEARRSRGGVTTADGSRVVSSMRALLHVATGFVLLYERSRLGQSDASRLSESLAVAARLSLRLRATRDGTLRLRATRDGALRLRATNDTTRAACERRERHGALRAHRLVAASTTMPLLATRPSIDASSWLSVCSTSSLLKVIRFERRLPSASISGRTPKPNINKNKQRRAGGAI